MWGRLLDSRWFYGVAAAGMLAAVVVSQLDIQRNPRPAGTPADISRLHERADLNLLFVLIDS